MFWDPAFEHVSGWVGAPPDQLKLIFSFLISYPLGSLFVRIPASRPNLSHLFSIIVSTFVIWPLLGLGGGLVHLLFSIAGTYAIVASSKSRNMPWIVFTFVMGHLLVNHVKRTFMAIPVSTIEITSAQMVLAMKLTTFAWNVHDGRQNIEDLDEAQRATRLTQMPAPLPFLGYCLFFASVMPGPSFDYATYDALITHTIYDKPPPGSQPTQKEPTKRRIPYGRKRVAYLHMVVGLVCLGAYAVFGQRADYSRILSDDWKSWSKTTKFGFIQFAGFIARTKYYAVWSLTEGACILTGIGFNGYDPKTGRTLWNRVRNINIIAIESAESFKVLFDSWNCRTNVWLRDVVYKRLTQRGRKPGTAQSMATFVTSAFWHGIDPGYYLAFVTAGLLTSLGRQFRHFVRPYFLSAASSAASSPNSLPRYPYPNLRKRIYDLAGWAIVQSTLNYTVAAFLLLRFGDCIRAWSRMGWYGHLAIAVAMLFFQCGGRRALRAGLPADAKRKRGKPEVGKANGPDNATPSVKVTPPQPHDERDPKDLEWIRHALDNPSSQDSGEGVTPDAGLVDRFVKGTETPGLERSGSQVDLRG
ncbi:Lysophospholipid acyltransferase [Cryptotrichosporon argae]